MQMNAVRTLTVRGQSQGLDRVEADLNKVSAAQTRVSQTSEGMARTTETSSRRQLSAGRDFQRLMERNDRMVYLQTQLARETATVNRAFEQGAVTAQQHARAIQLVETKYQGLVAAEQQARAASVAASAANDNQASSLHRLAAANDNARFASGNMAAQFQDIAVTAQMGMNPVMIALQQGTQLSAVLNTMQNPVKGLGMALLSVVNPVSLLTIGFVALAAAAIQFFSSSGNGAKETSDALKEQSDRLDDILRGYEKARKAADSYMESATRNPEGATASNIGKERETQLAAANTALDAIAAKEREIAADLSILRLGSDFFTDIVNASAGLDGLGLSANSTQSEINGVIDRLTALANNNDLPERVRGYASDLLAFVDQLRNANSEVGALDASLRALPRDIQIRLQVSQEYGAAMGEIADLFMDQRSRFDIARENLKNWTDQATATAQTYGELTGVGEQYTRVLDSINAAEAAANAKRAASAKASPEEKAADKYGDLIRDSQQYIAEQELAASALGLTAEAAARLRYEQEMLNQAANDNIALSDAQREEIGALATQMAEAEERTRSLSESFNFGRDVFKGFFSDLRQGLKEGDSLWEAFFNAASNAIDKLLDKAMSAALDQVWMGLWNSIMGGGLGGGGAGFLGGGAQSWGPLFPNANGNVFESPSLSAYSNQIHDTPKFFQFAKGVGEFAEAGPEAIMPLGRDGRGRLGVRVANENTPAAANSNVRIEIHNYSGAPVQQETSKGADGVDVTKIIIGAVNTAIADGRLDAPMAAAYGLKRRGM